MLKEKSCGAVVYKYVDDDIYVLLVKHNIGHWSFPKGHVEKNESEEETAIREIKEETNLDVILDNNFRFVNTYSPRYNSKKDIVKDVIYFVGYPTNDKIKAQDEEISDIKWYDVDKAYDIITYDNDKEVLRKAIEYITYEEEDNKSRN